MTVKNSDTVENELEQSNGPGRPGVSPEEVAVGDRVDLVLHGATSTNHAKGTVVDTNKPIILTNGITVELDKEHPNCEKMYGTSTGHINHIIGDQND